MRRWGGLFIFLGFAVLAVPALAGERDESDEPCENLGNRGQDYALGSRGQDYAQSSLIPECLGAISDRESLIAVSQLVHRVVVNELLGGGLLEAATESADLGGGGVFAITL